MMGEKTWEMANELADGIGDGVHSMDDGKPIGIRDGMDADTTVSVKIPGRERY